MTHGVVDPLEAVQIDQNHGKAGRSPGSFLDHRLAGLVEGTAVRQRGERIEIGIPVQQLAAFGECLCPGQKLRGAPVDLPFQIVLASAQHHCPPLYDANNPRARPVSPSAMRHQIVWYQAGSTEICSATSCLVQCPLRLDPLRPQPVAAGAEVGVRRDPMPGIGLNPGVVIAFQAVAVAVEQGRPSSPGPRTRPTGCRHPGGLSPPVRGP